MLLNLYFKNVTFCKHDNAQKVYIHSIYTVNNKIKHIANWTLQG